ncbi:hypothetical protein ABQG55_10970 [Aeromonas dhakensis]|uniref:hypothetical protein n=1 Tax=Aeromonas dhakensis TaxID=196024 RepID=UPI0032EE8679
MGEFDVNKFYTEGCAPQYTTMSDRFDNKKAQDGDEVMLGYKGCDVRVKDIARQDNGSWLGIVAHLVHEGADIHFQAGQQISFEDKNILRATRR